ncbi:MAG: glycosyltransferase family 4 protein [Acidimicrobiales bacterium]
MRLDFVVPRYAPGIRGGAEHACRMLAEGLARRPGWKVEVLTTCALDSVTWEPALDEGTAVIGGVTVRRFANLARGAGFAALCDGLLRAPEKATAADHRAWLAEQGPVSDGLVEAVAASAAELTAFTPYLFHPTVAGVAHAGDRAVLHPAAHDEAPLRLPLYRGLFTAARALVFYTAGERRLVEHRFPVATTPQITLGLGVSEGEGDAAQARADLGLGEAPFLACVGRVDLAKGTLGLCHWFRSYKARRPGPLRLVLVGQVQHRPPDHPDIVLTGPLDEPTKWGVLRGAAALVAPSLFESFSLALMEGWLAGLPALVNAESAVSLGHVRACGGGLAFAGYATFEAALDRLLGDPTLRATMGRAGRAYVEGNFQWPRAVERYASFLERLGGRGAG